MALSTDIRSILLVKRLIMVGGKVIPCFLSPALAFARLRLRASHAFLRYR